MHLPHAPTGSEVTQREYPFELSHAPPTPLTQDTTMHRFTTAAALVFAAAALVACSSEGPPGSGGAASGTDATASALGHVHGLGVDPGDGTLYIASHLGVFRVQDGEHELIADRQQDTMGFAVVGPGHFLGSGHPDPTEDLPSSLGLIESTDSAETWDSVSLMGDADFHAIEAVGTYIYALDSYTGSLLVSADRENWDTIAQQPLFDLAANPADPQTIYAITDRGALVRFSGRAAPAPIEGAPTMTAIDWQPDGPLVGVTPDGTVMVSPGGEADWQQAGTLDGQVEALDAAPGRWHAATATGVYESTDDGATWTLVLDPAH